MEQAVEMGLMAPDGYGYRSTKLGYDFFEAFKNNDRTLLDDILSKYSPYMLIKGILSQRSSSLSELMGITGLNEVGVEMMVRLLQYTRDDFCVIGERYCIRSKELPEINRFVEILKNVYEDLNEKVLYGCSKRFIPIEMIAKQVCLEMRLTLDDFSKLLEETQKINPYIEVHSEEVGYGFFPIRFQRTNNNYLRCYLCMKK
ncbi:hypothetical protein KEJ17_05570 [Candidatus Bathyarchaeota archaeon]|nr:hypothetical protein [Candidatus Bathyarchaeota archaeon]